MGYVFDTNVHLLAVDAAGQPVPPGSGRIPEWWAGSTAEQVRGHMQQAGIDHTLVVATGTYDDSYVLASAQKYPDTFTCVGKVDVSAEDADKKLDQLWNTPGIGGIRFEVRGEGADPSDWLDSEAVRPLWQQAADNNMRISLASVRKMEHLVPLHRVLERFPNLNVVLRRMVQPPIEDGPPYQGAQNLFALSAYPNVHSTFSHLNIEETDKGDSTHQAFFETFIEKFGSNRLMWASFFPAYRAPGDEPVKGLIDYVRAELAFLPEADLDQVLGGAAKALYSSK